MSNFHFTGVTLDGDSVTFDLTDIDVIFADDDVLYINTPQGYRLPLTISSVQAHLLDTPDRNGGKKATDKVYFSHADLNDDGIDDAICVYVRDWNIPLIGDYRGVEIARIRYTPSRPDSIAYATLVAQTLVTAFQARFSDEKFYITDEEDVLAAFAAEMREYPNDSAEDAWMHAGGLFVSAETLCQKGKASE